MHVFIAMIGAQAAEGCANGSCPAPHETPAPVARPGSLEPPPIDRKKHAHLRTATFALG